MSVERKYDIAYKGLGEGKHEFVFGMDNGFFESFANPEVLGGEATAEVTLEKLPASLMLTVGIRGQVAVECDRCLGECSLPVEFEGNLTVKFTDEQLTESERYDGEVMWLGYNDGVLNLAQYLYESVILSLPYQRVHPEGEDGAAGCNPEMLEKFSIISQEEFDRLTGPQEQEMADNPEWEKLRKLKEEME
ncbi:MAG: DUF177 domain-containing protein [Alistipes sp.]|nr:DUF177 domain-containing protein [Alistipes sp.]